MYVADEILDIRRAKILSILSVLIVIIDVCNYKIKCRIIKTPNSKKAYLFLHIVFIKIKFIKFPQCWKNWRVTKKYIRFSDQFVWMIRTGTGCGTWTVGRTWTWTWRALGRKGSPDEESQSPFLTTVGKQIQSYILFCAYLYLT